MAQGSRGRCGHLVTTGTSGVPPVVSDMSGTAMAARWALPARRRTVRFPADSMVQSERRGSTSD